MFGSYEDQRRLLDTIKQIEASVKSIDKVVSKGTEAVKRAAKEVKTQTDNVRDVNQEIVELQVSGLDAAGQKLDALIAKMKGHLVGAAQSVDKSVMGQFLWGKEGPNALSGQYGGAARMLQGLQHKVLSELPMAGFLGLLLYGVKGEEKWRATAEQTIQIFDRLKGGADKYHGAAEALARRSVAGAFSPDDLQAAATAFTEGGVAADAAFKQLNQTISNTGDSLIEWSLRVDKTLELGAGTSAKAIAEIARTSGVAAEEAAAQFKELAEAQRASGVSATAFLGAMTQMRSGFQMQMQDIGGLAKSYTLLRGVMPGNDIMKGHLGLEGLQQVGGSIQGMDIGWKEVIGQRILREKFGVTNATGGAGFSAMVTGFDKYTGGRPFDTVGEALRAALRIKEEQTKGLGEFEKGRFVKTQFAGISDELAQRLAGLTGNEAPGEIPQEVSDAFAKELASGFSKESSKLDQINLVLERLHDLLARVGASLVKTLVGVAASIAMGVQAFMEYERTGDASGALDRWNAGNQAVFDDVKQAWLKTADAAKDIAEAKEIRTLASSFDAARWSLPSADEANRILGKDHLPPITSFDDEKKAYTKLSTSAVSLGQKYNLLPSWPSFNIPMTTPSGEVGLVRISAEALFGNHEPHTGGGY